MSLSTLDPTSAIQRLWVALMFNDITNEYLSFHAVKAFATSDMSYAKKVLNVLANLQTDPSFSEWFDGRAGTLYILRIIRTWVPESIEEINQAMKPLIEHLLNQDS